jgi:gliding motility-associated protein GldM
MINIMYLVLTAMLALNVSAEILNAFKTVKTSLEHSSNAIEDKNVQIFKSFDQMLKDPTKALKANEWYPYAQKAKTLSDDAYKYIEALKMELMREAGYNPPKDTAFKMDDLDAATRLLVEQKKKGPELLKKLTAFKTQLLALHPDITAEFKSTLPIDLSIPVTQNKEIKTWEGAYFHMTPAIAALTILSKFQNDIRNSEVAIVEYCHKQVGEVEVVYDQFKAIANASASYVMPDEEIVINAGVGAFSSAAKPSVTVDGSGTQALPDGSYEYKFKAPTAAGEYTKKVRVSFVKPDGTTATVDKDIKYTVGQLAGLTVSTDKTRVFYSGGLANPLSVTGAGGSEKIQLSVEGPGITVEKLSGGNYEIKCTQPGTAIVKASDGKTTQEFKIPIKRVPDPVATVNGKQGGDMQASQFKSAGGVAAKLKDFIFEGYSFKVVSFAMYFTGAGFEEKTDIVEVNGNAFSAEARKSMNKCVSGSTVIIGGIKVADQIGNVRELDGNISFVLE